MAEQHPVIGIAIMRAIERNRIWIQFKQDWDGNIPLETSSSYPNYIADANAASVQIQMISDRILKEFADRGEK